MKNAAEEDRRPSISLEEKQQKYRGESYRRSKMEIYLDILWMIKNGVDRPTRIMYRANLSWKPFQETLKFLLDRGMLETANSKEGDETRKTYQVTPKGDEVIKYFTLAKNLLKPISLTDHT